MSHVPKPVPDLVPAVVLPSPHHVGLGITRSLGRLGVPVFNVDSSRWAPAFFSKYCRGRSVWDFETASSEASLEFLTQLAERIGKPSVLIPTTDTTAVFMADHEEALRNKYVFARQDSLLVRALCNKSDMHNLARKTGVCVPDSTVPKTRSDLWSCFKTSVYPLILKSIDTRYRKRKSKTKVLLRNRQEAYALYDRIQDEVIGNVMVQDWIPVGPATDWMFNGYFDQRSRRIAAFTGKKARQFPPDLGVTSLGICEANQAVEEIATRFLGTLRYRGAVDMDFRYDYRDRKYKLLDVNPRVGGSFRLFVSEDNLDIVRVLYLDQTGRPVAAPRLPEGRTWAVEDYDFVAAFHYVSQRRVSARKWLASFRDVQEFGFLSADDPIPAILMLRDDLSEMLALLESARRPVAPFENNPGAATSEFTYSNSPASQGEL